MERAMTDDDLESALTALVPALLQALEELGQIARHLHPMRLDALLEAAGPRETTLGDARARFDASAWPEQLAALRHHLASSADETMRAFEGLHEAAASPEGPRQAYRALRHATHAEAALYPVASVLPTVNRFYLEPEARGDTALQERLIRADPTRSDIGVMHSGEKPGERGGFSLYVPEDYDAARAHPLVMALHGGSGNGGAFLWSWLRAARTRGAILVPPTALGSTWDLRDPEQDSVNIEAILAHVHQNWTIDPARLLLTGMSDGGTFALLSGLSDTSPFTHLAPAATGFHPFLLEIVEPARVANLPIYLIHGALDWMFDVGRARGVARALATAGAKIVYREIDDLSHTYPRDENSKILDWLSSPSPSGRGPG
jgi:phospholipase/carboxylesterase